MSEPKEHFDGYERWNIKQRGLRTMTTGEVAALGHKWQMEPWGWWRCECGATLPSLDLYWFQTPIKPDAEPCGCLACTPHG